MNKTFVNTCITVALVVSGVAQVKAQSSYTLPKPVQIELNRLEESYNILDQFSEKAWPGWNNYLEFPFLMTFQNGLRVLVGHPSPPAGFVIYPKQKVHGLTVFIDTMNLNNFTVEQPLLCGGGVLPYGTDKNKKPVLSVDVSLTHPTGDAAIEAEQISAEDHILMFMHELMHCYQRKIMKNEYGNLNLNPDLNHALYSDIEGLALLFAGEQDSREKALPFLKDFCIARSFKYDGMSKMEKLQARGDEFREGEAVYTEYIILENLKKDFKSQLTTEMDPGYTQFRDADKYLKIKTDRLREDHGKTLEISMKNYHYGCFEALMLQHYFPGWQQEIESGGSLDLVLRKDVRITASDSLESLKRFRDLYQIDSLRSKHEKIISGRNATYAMFNSLKGMTYVIDFKPIRQFISGLADPKLTRYSLGLLVMFPDGIGSLKFDGVSLETKPVPTEANQLYYIKMVDTNPTKADKPYTIEYQLKEPDDVYRNVVITTPLFTLRAPKVQLRERENRIKIVILSRV